MVLLLSLKVLLDEKRIKSEIHAIGASWVNEDVPSLCAILLNLDCHTVRFTYIQTPHKSTESLYYLMFLHLQFH